MRLESFIQKNACKLAVLIDPDKFDSRLIAIANKCHIDCFLVGGSGSLKRSVNSVVKAIKKQSTLPVILFPGNEHQLSLHADGLLLLSLLSGRNPEYLIAKHVRAAPKIKKMQLPFLPTAYLLIGGGTESTTQKVTQTQALTQPKEILNTALAAQQLGFKAIYLEAGSGASKNISTALIKRIRKEIDLPLIVGGGINSLQKAKKIKEAGANLIVIGNALEKNPDLLFNISVIFNPK